MYKEGTILGIIPARGGSKGLPKKNKKSLFGKPLIAWTIEQALLCKYIDNIIVSTDDNEIANISKFYGAKVPFMRPPELATDTARGMDVLLHAMDWVKKNEKKYDYVIYLQPTSPLRTSEDINSSLLLMDKKEARAVVSVCKSEHPPIWSNILPDNGSLNGFIAEYIVNKNRQEINSYYRLNGAIYLASWDYIMENKNWFKEGSYGYIMSLETSVDIDTELDFLFAEFLLRRKKQKNKSSDTQNIA